MATFASAARAIVCAAASRRRWRRRKEHSPENPIEVRIGLNAGEPVNEGKDIFGTSVQLARRICDHAAPGQVLVSDVVRQLVAGKDVVFGDTGSVDLKGFAEPVHLYEVLRPRKR